MAETVLVGRDLETVATTQGAGGHVNQHQGRARLLAAGQGPARLSSGPMPSTKPCHSARTHLAVRRRDRSAATRILNVRQQLAAAQE